MLPDYKMIVHNFPRKPITIYVVADVHFGAIDHCQTEWKAFCDRIAKEENAYLFLAGDLVNNSLRSSVANPFDEIVRPREQKERMVDFLRPLSDKILCCVPGNHEGRTTKEADMDIAYDVMARLGKEDVYRQNFAVVKIGLGQKVESPMVRCAYTFVVTHGTGGGIYTGASVNRNERFGGMVDGMDCLVTAHVHKGFVTRPSKIVIDARNETVSKVDYTVVSAVSWLNYGGYAAKKMLLPASVANPQKLVLSDNPKKKEIKIVW